MVLICPTCRSVEKPNSLASTTMPIYSTLYSTTGRLHKPTGGRARRTHRTESRLQVDDVRVQHAAQKRLALSRDARQVDAAEPLDKQRLARQAEACESAIEVRAARLVGRRGRRARCPGKARTCE
eukprot:scaffold32784_cov69-Phaeocystis_antarctica.AAC.5